MTITGSPTVEPNVAEHSRVCSPLKKFRLIAILLDKYDYAWNKRRSYGDTVG